MPLSSTRRRKRRQLRDKRTIAFLGDLVDRGPDSLGAIDPRPRESARGRDEAIALKGNHETTMWLALQPETPWDDAIDVFDTWSPTAATGRWPSWPSRSSRPTISMIC